MPNVTDDKGDVIGTTDGAPAGFYFPLVALHDRNTVEASPVEPELATADPGGPLAY